MSKAAAVDQLPLRVTSLERARLVMSHIPPNPAAEWSRPIRVREGGTIGNKQ